MAAWRSAVGRARRRAWGSATAPSLCAIDRMQKARHDENVRSSCLQVGTVATRKLASASARGGGRSLWEMLCRGQIHRSHGAPRSVQSWVRAVLVREGSHKPKGTWHRARAPLRGSAARVRAAYRQGRARRVGEGK